MKHARFYTALPRVGGRVRSNSASSSRALYTNPATLAFFDAPPPPPPNTRLTTHRLPIEARGEVEGPNNGNGNPHPTHAPLALAAPHAPGTNQHSQPGHAQLALLFPYTPGPLPKSTAGPATSNGGRAHRRRGTKYTLDVGAYGIPKRGHGHGNRGVRALHTEATDAPLAVQVGEDAYFVRENAMGVADGVGGWARVKHPAPSGGPSASALFARRLMHFCADEVDRASHLHSDPQVTASTSRVRTEPVPVVQPWRPPPSRFAPYPPSASYVHAGPSSLPSAGAWPIPTAAGFAPSSTYASSYSDPGRNEYSPYDPYIPARQEDAWLGQEQEWDEYDEYASPADALAAELDELADGLDVLHILERAYERTLTAHVVPAPPSPSTSPPASTLTSMSAVGSVPIPTTGRTNGAATPTRVAPTAWPFTKIQTQTRTDPPPKTIPLLAGSSTALVAVLDYVPAGEVDVAIASSSSAATSTSTTAPKSKGPTDAASASASTDAELTPVLKIAHVGDCMGMLVRGGEVAWRSEEMWWRWNTPVQLSAVPTHTSTTSPAAPAPAATEIGKVAAGKAGWWTSFAAPSSSSAPSTPTSHSATASGNGKATTATTTQVTPSSAAHLFTLPVQAGDIVILASDGLSDNLWDEDVLEEVGRVRGVFETSESASVGDSGYTSATEEVFEMALGEEKEIGEGGGSVDGARLRRQTLAGMLSEALCSRARRVATRRAGRERGRPCSSATSSLPTKLADVPEATEERAAEYEYEDDTPFARRARETGRVYRGGKNDDISVIVAVIAPAEEHAQRGRGRGRGRVEAARAAGS